MPDGEWFYHAGGKRHGPVDLGQLVAALCSFENARNVQVWNKSLPGWLPAGEVKEVSKQPLLFGLHPGAPLRRGTERPCRGLRRVLAAV